MSKKITPYSRLSIETAPKREENSKKKYGSKSNVVKPTSFRISPATMKILREIERKIGENSRFKVNRARVLEMIIVFCNEQDPREIIEVYMKDY